uniref:Phospholipid/glycerol acyltransferase domain-containing protein n=1 Tax=Spongospora subterranea TaxID=70186 RepID=A0A0H5QWJ8_9EUKA|eukprot:CRZ06011.1 hypothetical protein [Spongospora subterranea]
MSVLESFAGRSLLITGCTGFIGKVLLEKLFRCVPKINSMYLLIRPIKGCSAEQRVRNEIISSPVFNRLRHEIGDAQFENLAKTKIVVLSGDLGQQKLGLSESWIKIISEKINIIIHCAASVDFNLRLDLAVEQNVYGTMRVLDIAESCKNLEIFVHISTAYTNCTQTDHIIEEKLYPCTFDINEMLATISRLSSRELQKVTVDALIGDWPNTYTFTKFITEHLIAERCKQSKFAVSIVRPTIVGAAWVEPIPGWIDVISAAGALYVAVGLGVVRVLPGNPDHIGDIVPVDFVVNAILRSVPIALSQPNRFFICQAAASVIRPWRWRHAINTLPTFFDTHPSKHAISPTVSFTMIPNKTMYEVHFLARYAVPSAILNAVSFIGTKTQKRTAEQFQRLIVKLHTLVDAFRYFTEHEWRFDCQKLFSIGNEVYEAEAEHFWLDLSPIDYTQYHRAFAYGLLRFVLKEDLIEIDDPRSSRQICLTTQNGEQVAGNGMISRVFPDLFWAVSQMKQQPSIGGPNLTDMKAAVLSSPRVQAVLTKLTEDQPDVSPAQAAAHAASILDLMVGDIKPSVMTGMAAGLKKLFRRLYSNVFINHDGVESVRRASTDGVPIIYVPTHRSYMDFLLLSYTCFVNCLPVPYIAAGDDFLEVAVVRYLFRHSGAFFIRRSFKDDFVYKAIFEEYVRQILCLGKSLEFFIEGSRSRSGKMVHPKLGLLQVICKTLIEGDIKDAIIVPIAINYERTLEGGIYSQELHGSSKIQETLRNLISASKSVLSSSFGRISIRIGTPISVLNAVNLQSNLHDITRPLAYRISYELQSLGEVMPTHILSTLLLMYRRGISHSQLVTKFCWLRREILNRNGRVILFEAEKLEWVVDNAILLLKNVIEERHHKVFEPKISHRSDYPNMLLLGHYRNKIVNIFFRESIWACAFHSIGLDSCEGVDRGVLFESAAFLFSLLKREIVCSPDPDAVEDFDASFDVMVQRSVFRLLPNNRVEIDSEATFSFLCALCWPFIDSYFAAGLFLHTLQGSVEEKQVIIQTQWLATTLYHESMICFYESCSSDTLQNALTTFQEEFGITCKTRRLVVKNTGIKGNQNSDLARQPTYVTDISVRPNYQDGVELQQLIHRIDLLRKRPPVVRTSLRRAMIAEIPLLAKL